MLHWYMRGLVLVPWDQEANGNGIWSSKMGIVTWPKCILGHDKWSQILGEIKMQPYTICFHLFLTCLVKP